MEQSEKAILSEAANPYMPKFMRIKAFIEERILSGEFIAGQLIPSEKELATQFSVDKNTVVKALNELKIEGVVYRVQGKGTFVSQPKTALTAKEIVGLVMPATGHLYGPLATGIVNGLTEHHYFCLVVDPTFVDNKKQPPGAIREGMPTYEKIKALLEKAPGNLVIEGTNSFPYELLMQYQGRTIFVDVCETEKDYPSTRILSNYHEGGRMVVEHFIRAGHTQVLYFAHPVKKENKTQIKLIEGARRAFRDHNLPEDNFIIYADLLVPDDAELNEKLRNLKKPLAVFCHSDIRAKRIYTAAHQLGLRIPQDISIIGYYNTPWCEVFEPNLSSVSIREQDIAEHVVKAILTGNDRDILLKPQLILRDSSLNQ